MSGITPTSPVITPNANKPVDSIKYTKTHPTLERVGGIAVETGLALAAHASGINTPATILGFGVLESIDIRGKTETAVRKLTADQIINYTDGSKDTIQHASFSDMTRTSHATNGAMINKIQIRNGSQIHTQYQNGKPTSTTYYPAQGGIIKCGPDGRLQSQDSCTIL